MKELIWLHSIMLLWPKVIWELKVHYSIFKTSNGMFQCVAVVILKKKWWNDISSLFQDPFSQEKSEDSFKRKYCFAASD